MSRFRLSALTTNQRLALLALALGAAALFAGSPDASGRVTIDRRELAAMVEGEVDHVTPDQLAAWIVAGRQDYRLIDLRSEAEFAADAIPGAERIAIPDLVEAELPRNEKIVLYSAEGIHSAQAWFLLKAERYPAVYLLLGGLKQWQEEVVYPVQPGAEASATELAEFAKAAERARFFGGAPRAASAESPLLGQLAPRAAAPKVAAPAGPAGAGAKKKKKEGC